MANVCRLCGNNEGHAIFIFGNEALKHHIDLKIRAGLDIQIFPDDPLPKHACIWCLGKLDEFWTFLHQCRRVQTKLRRLLPERIPFQFENINNDQRKNSMTSTEECSGRIEVLQTFDDFTGNDCNNPGDLYSIINGKSEVHMVKVEPHFSENSNNSYNSYNDSCENECEPCVANAPYFIATDVLAATQNDTSLATRQLDSCCQDRKENMAISAAGYTSESALENNPGSVEGESEVQDNLSSENTNLTNTFHGRSETTLSVNSNNGNCNALSDRPQDFQLMEEQILEVPNVRSTTSILSVAEKEQEDKILNETFWVNNDLNKNQFQPQNTISRSNRYLTTANKGHSEKRSRDTCGFLDSNYQSLLLMEEHPSNNRKGGRDGTQVISTVVVNNVSNNEKEFECYSAFNTLQPLLLKGGVACKTTSSATDNCSRDVPVHEAHHAEVTQGDGIDSSKHSLIFTDLPLNHPNHVGSGMTNVSSSIEASQIGSSIDYNPLYLLENVCNTIPQVTGKLTRNTEFDLGGLSITGESQPLQVMHSSADMADMSDQNMVISGIVSDLIEAVAVTIENDVRRNRQLNTSLRSDSNPSHDNKEHSIIVNSGSSATCVHGIDASMCIFKKCCDSHPFDKYWNKVGCQFRCLLCEYVTEGETLVRRHISAHVSLNIFECSVCYKKLRSFKNLNLHMKIHSRKDDTTISKVRGVYSCEYCSKSFTSKSYLREHQIKKCEIGSVSCPGCGLRFSSLKRHTYNCPGKTGFVCDICNKSHKAKQELIKHLRTHDQGEYACDKCEKIYSKLYLLRNHQNAVHGTGKFKCTHCTKTFRVKFNFEQHVTSHTGIRNYLCEICSKTFLTSGNLATHLKFHGKRDIKCNLCGKMYFRKNMLLSHMKNVHCK